MVRKQVLRAQGHSREGLLQKVKSESDQNKLAFNITYYLVFQNLRNMLQELHILLTPNKEHKKVFQDIPESCGKGNCQVCDFLCDTDGFSTKICREKLKIQSGILNCNSQKVVYLLKCRICGEVPYIGKAKTKFRGKLMIIKVHTGPIEKNVKYHNSVFMNIMANRVLVGLMISSSH